MTEAARRRAVADAIAEATSASATAAAGLVPSESVLRSERVDRFMAALTAAGYGVVHLDEIRLLVERSNGTAEEARA